MAFQFSIAQHPHPTVALINVLTSLGLTTNLKLVLDAGDALSVTSASATKWLDRSGNGYDFFCGTDATVQATDPTFNGTVGGKSASEYYSFDGGDYHRYDSANEPWMAAPHKDGAVLSWAAWVYLTADSNRGIVGTTGASAGGVGFYIGLNLSAQNFTVYNTSLAFTAADTTTYSTGKWQFLAGRVDEAANAISFCTNGTISTTTCTFTSPNAGAASYTMEISAIGNGFSPLSSGSRIAHLAMWQGTALSTANLSAIFEATRATFGI
jgi:hypothetical protein